MSNIKLDLSKFKHLKSDKHTTTLQHPAGHTITLAHDAVSKDTKAQLDALAKVAKDSQTPLQADEAKHTQAMATGGEVEDAPQAQESRPDTGWGAIIVKGKAEGGEIKADHECEGKAFCMHCGGKMGGHKMYANPQAPVSNDDSAPTSFDDMQGAPPALAADAPAQAAPPQPPAALSPTPDYNVLPGVSASIPDAKAATDKDVQNWTPEDESKWRLKEFEKRLQAKRAMNGPDEWGGSGETEDEMREDVMADMANERYEKKQDEAKMQQNNAEMDALRQKAGLPPEVLNRPDQSDPSKVSPQTGLPDQSQALNPTPTGVVPQGNGSGQNPGIGMDYTSMLQKGFNNQLAGIDATAKAQQDWANQRAQVQQSALQANQEAQSHFDQAYQDLNNERQNFIQDIQNGHIDPDKYWDNHSKLATGIGMILAGFNPTNSPNAAVNFLKFQMEQNLNAQAKNLGAKESLLNANMQHFRNLHDAMDMTRLMQADMVAHKLDIAASQAANPLAKAAALNAKGQLMQQYAPLALNLSMRSALMNMARGGNQNPQAVEHMITQMEAMGMPQAKTYREAYVPGVGLSSSLQPIPAEVRQQIVAGQTLQNTAQDLLNYSKMHTNLVPGTAEYNTGVQKAQILQQRIREGLLGTVFRESEKPLLEKFVEDNPAGFMKAFSTQPKLRQIIESNLAQMNTLKQNYGLPVQAPAAQPQFKIVNGVKYMRGPNGEAIPVK